jgi:hypothetical protein
MGAPSILRRVALVLLMCVGLAGTVTVAASAVASPAGALCVTPPEQGSWHNIDASTNAITRADVSLASCGDVVLCDTSGHCTGGQTTFNVRLSGKCHPTDCDWGNVVATQRSDGWIVGTYNFGFKVSTAWVKTYSYYGLTYLRVYVSNHFTDGRADYVTDEWFLR